ncbi:septum formation family protein [Arthrobacter sp. UYEF3]|uniref:septum formation family protein n=1 Tax=Arthrobacter sp. UYEF3 TaxID=1756365 RepID=UPI003391BDB7
MTEDPVSDEDVKRRDTGVPYIPRAAESADRPAPAPPVGAPSSVHVPPRPSAPPTSAVPVLPGGTDPESRAPSSRRAAARSRTRTTPRATPDTPATAKDPDRKGSSGASQIGRLLSAQTAQLRAAQLGPRTRELGRTLWAGAQRLGLAKVGIAAVVVLGLLVWWLTSLGTPAQQPAAGTLPAPEASSSAPARGALPLEGVSPMDFRLGDCFKDFDANAAASTVVACDTGHSAQLVAIESYAASDAYPGRDPLKQRALGACKAAALTEKSNDYTLSYKLAYPSSSSWGTGDRRVDCYIAADGGNIIKESLLP